MVLGGRNQQCSSILVHLSTFLNHRLQVDCVCSEVLSDKCCIGESAFNLLQFGLVFVEVVLLQRSNQYVNVGIMSGIMLYIPSPHSPIRLRSERVVSLDKPTQKLLMLIGDVLITVSEYSLILTPYALLRLYRYSPNTSVTVIY